MQGPTAKTPWEVRDGLPMVMTLALIVLGQEGVC